MEVPKASWPACGVVVPIEPEVDVVDGGRPPRVPGRPDRSHALGGQAARARWCLVHVWRRTGWWSLLSLRMSARGLGAIGIGFRHRHGDPVEHVGLKVRVGNAAGESFGAIGLSKADPEGQQR